MAVMKADYLDKYWVVLMVVLMGSYLAASMAVLKVVPKVEK
jgi:hypothetical protein